MSESGIGQTGRFPDRSVIARSYMPITDKDTGLFSDSEVNLGIYRLTGKTFLTIIDNCFGAELVEQPRVFITSAVLVDNLETDTSEIAPNTTEIVPVNTNDFNTDILITGHYFPNSYDTAQHSARVWLSLCARVAKPYRQ